MPKISQSSPEFAALKKQRLESDEKLLLNQNFNYFGADLFRNIAMFPEREGEFLDNEMNLLAQLYKAPYSDKRHGRRIKDGIVGICITVLHRADLRSEVATALGLNDWSLTAGEVVNGIVEKKIPVALFKKVIEQYAQNFLQTEKYYNEKYWPEVSEKILERFEALCNKYRLPRTPEQARKMASLIQIHLADQLTGETDEIYALHVKFLGVMTLDLSKIYPKDDDLDHVVAHEFTHDLAGAAAQKKTADGQDTVRFEREGFHVVNARKEWEKAQNFKWLNEAVTEKFALEIGFLRNGERAAYAQEQTLLELLIENANPPIEIGDFYRAYFEDFEPDQEGGPIPNFRELMKKINTAYGNGFLGGVG